MGQYKKLCAIVETRPHLAIEIMGKSGNLFLVLRDTRRRRLLATAPFQAGCEDEAAEDLARQATLDGTLPPGMAS